MRKMKLLGVLVIVLVAITFLGVVSAAEVEIGNQKFNLPDGFKEDVSSSKEMVSSSNSTTYVKKFTNDAGDSVLINVVTAPPNVVGVNLPDDADAKAKTINGVNGSYNENGHKFSYINGTTMIIISGNNESVVEEFIK